MAFKKTRSTVTFRVAFHFTARPVTQSVFTQPSHQENTGAHGQFCGRSVAAMNVIRIVSIPGETTRLRNSAMYSGSDVPTLTSKSAYNIMELKITPRAKI